MNKHIMYNFWTLQQEDTIEQLEQSIKAAREAALDAADTDSVITGTSITGGQEGNFFIFCKPYIWKKRLYLGPVNNTKILSITICRYVTGLMYYDILLYNIFHLFN